MSDDERLGAVIASVPELDGVRSGVGARVIALPEHQAMVFEFIGGAPQSDEECAVALRCARRLIETRTLYLPVPARPQADRLSGSAVESRLSR